MAKNNLIKVKALVYLKYDKTCVAINEEFDARKKDVKEMQDKGFVEVLEEMPEENQEDGGDPPKDGE